MKNKNIFLRVQKDWEFILKTHLEIDDFIKPNKLESHLLMSSSLRHGISLNTNFLIKGGKISEILSNVEFINQNNIIHEKEDISFSLYCYCDSLGFRRGNQPLNSSFTYPFLVKKSLESYFANNSINLLLRGRGGQNFNKLYSMLGTDIGYMGSFSNSNNLHSDIIIIQSGLVDFSRYRNSNIYKVTKFFLLGKLFDQIFLKFYIKKNINKIKTYLYFLRGNFKAFVINIGSHIKYNDILLNDINEYLQASCNSSIYFIDTRELDSDCFIDEGHLSELGHEKFARLVTNSIINAY